MGLVAFPGHRVLWGGEWIKEHPKRRVGPNLPLPRQKIGSLSFAVLECELEDSWRLLPSNNWLSYDKMNAQTASVTCPKSQRDLTTGPNLETKSLGFFLLISAASLFLLWCFQTQALYFPPQATKPLSLWPLLLPESFILKTQTPKSEDALALFFFPWEYFVLWFVKEADFSNLGDVVVIKREQWPLR